MITGGTGSFGNAVVRKFLDTDIKEIRIFSRDEKKQDDMRKLYARENVSFYIGDVRDKERLKRAMEGIDYVIHAAALKHVNIGEYNPMEVIKTNVMGAQNVVETCLDQGVKNVII